jgi:hypothetical protein
MKTQLVKMDGMRMRLLVMMTRVLLARGATAAVTVSAGASAIAGILSIGATIAGFQRTAECPHVHS